MDTSGKQASTFWGLGLQYAVLGSLLLAVVVVPLYFSPLFQDYNLPKQVLLEVLVVLAAVLWVLRMAVGGEISVIRSPLYATVLVFLGVNLVSLLWAGNRAQGLTVIFQYACWFLIPVVVFHGVRSAAHLRLLAGAMAFTGGVVALIGLLQYNGIYSLYTRDTYPVSTIGNVTFVAEYYDVVFPITLSLVFLFRNIWLRLAALAVCVLVGAHLVVMGSRGGWLGAAVALSIFLGVWLIRRLRIGYRLLYVAVIWIAAVAGWAVLDDVTSAVWVGPGEDVGDLAGDRWARMAGRMEKALNVEDDASLQRVYLWQDTFRMASDRFLIGVGAGNFEYAIPRYASRQALEVKTRLERRQRRELMAFRAHNDYLEIWAETGILGLGAFCVLLYQVGAAIYGLLKRYVQGEGDILIVGLAAAFVATLAHALVSMNFQNPASGLSFWLVVGMAWSLKLNREGAQRLRILTVRQRSTTLRVAAAGVLVLAGTVAVEAQALFGAYHYHLGATWLKQEGYASAQSELERALRYRSPRAFLVYQALGLSLSGQGRWTEAAQAFEESLARHPNNATVHHHLGVALGQVGRHEEAAAHFQEAIALSPASAAFHLKLGQALAESGDRRAAFRAFEQAEALAANRPEVLNDVGFAYMTQQHPEPARRVWQGLVDRWPGGAEYRLNLSVALIKLGEQEAALAQCRQALKRVPKSARAYAVLGAIYESQGDSLQAREAYQKAFAR